MKSNAKLFAKLVVMATKLLQLCSNLISEHTVQVYQSLTANQQRVLFFTCFIQCVSVFNLQEKHNSISPTYRRAIVDSKGCNVEQSSTSKWNQQLQERVTWRFPQGTYRVFISLSDVRNLMQKICFFVIIGDQSDGVTTGQLLPSQQRFIIST